MKKTKKDLEKEVKELTKHCEALMKKTEAFEEAVKKWRKKCDALEVHHVDFCERLLLKTAESGVLDVRKRHFDNLKEPKPPVFPVPDVVIKDEVEKKDPWMKVSLK